jgi:hypothetical protein
MLFFQDQLVLYPLRPLCFRAFSVDQRSEVHADGYCTLLIWAILE